MRSKRKSRTTWGGRKKRGRRKTFFSFTTLSARFTQGRKQNRGEGWRYWTHTHEKENFSFLLSILRGKKIRTQVPTTVLHRETYWWRKEEEELKKTFSLNFRSFFSPLFSSFPNWTFLLFLSYILFPVAKFPLHWRLGRCSALFCSHPFFFNIERAQHPRQQAAKSFVCIKHVWDEVEVWLGRKRLLGIKCERQKGGWHSKQDQKWFWF